MKNSILILILASVSLTAMSAQVCVGDSARVTWKFWNNYLQSSYQELEVQENYPLSPSRTKTLYRLQVPTNYEDMFGAIVEGFIQVPSTETVQFNITGNGNAEFYLSSDDSPENIERIMYTPGGTGSTEHDQDTTVQNSELITLQANQYYFFRLRQHESYGGDHAAVWWKTDLVDPANWNIITAAYLWDVGCENTACPERGTPCDDSNPNTLNDLQDGFCHCLGTPITSDTCIGERSEIMAYRYDSIAGSELGDLYESQIYPSMPHDGKILSFLGTPDINDLNNIGNLVQGYITVPETGNYKFNVSGDDGTIFFLSSDESIENKQDNFCVVANYTSFNQFDKYIFQSTGNIFLVKDQYYFFEINHKEGGGSEHFAVNWQTPFTEPGNWKRIPTFYLYDYNCELACIDQGTPCDDGNPFTNNDQFNAYCDCEGTPCSGPDCDSPLANYIPYDPCNVSDYLDNNASNNWLSCSKDENPNDLRDSSHWIMYDFGERYELYRSHVWNYNVANEVENGFEAVSIDISEDGTTWIELGTFNWPLASGESAYSGFTGPDYQGVYAQYVLITSLEADNSCRGLGKVTFEAVLCPLQGTVCDDSDDNTILDHFDNNCECKGVPLDANLCSEVFLLLGDSLLSTNNFSAEQYVQSISKIQTNERVSMIGGQYVELNPGFETEEQTLFLASIAECLELPAESSQAALKQAIKKKRAAIRKADELAVLQVLPIKGSTDKLVKFHVNEPGLVRLGIYDESGMMIRQILDTEFRNTGVYRKRIRMKRLPPKAYTFKLIRGENDVHTKYSTAD